MSLGHGVDIPRSGLKFTIDTENIKSYSGSGNSWINPIDSYTSTGGSSTPSSFNSPSFLSSAPLTTLTIITVVTILGTDTAYAYHPISKWSSTTDATFALYHFQQFTDSLRIYNLGFYANAGGTWKSISPWYTGAQNQTYHITLQYNSTQGGQMWINGAKFGSRTGSGTLANNNINIKVDGGPQPRTGIHQTKSAWIYNRELTDVEIQSHYNALRGRYAI